MGQVLHPTFSAAQSVYGVGTWLVRALLLLSVCISRPVASCVFVHATCCVPHAVLGCRSRCVFCGRSAIVISTCWLSTAQNCPAPLGDDSVHRVLATIPSAGSGAAIWDGVTTLVFFL